MSDLDLGSHFCHSNKLQKVTRKTLAMYNAWYNFAANKYPWPRQPLPRKNSKFRFTNDCNYDSDVFGDYTEGRNKNDWGINSYHNYVISFHSMEVFNHTVKFIHVCTPLQELDNISLFWEKVQKVLIKSHSKARNYCEAV